MPLFHGIRRYLGHWTKPIYPLRLELYSCYDHGSYRDMFIWTDNLISTTDRTYGIYTVQILNTQRKPLS